MKEIPRRNFIKISSGAFASLSGFACSGRSSLRDQGCSIGYGSYGLPGYSVEDAIRLVSNIGFDSIELACIPGFHGDPNTLSKQSRKKIRTLLIDLDLKLGALMGLPQPSEQKHKVNKEQDYIKRMVELSHDLTIQSPSLIQGVLGTGDWEQKKTLFRDRLGAWASFAQQAGVTLAIKPHRGQAMSLPENGVWIITELRNPKHLRLVYDYSHFAYRGYSIEETVKTAYPYTSYIAVKDAIQVNQKIEFALPGATNTINHARVLKLFFERGYRGEICCEISSQVWRKDGYDPVWASKTCYKNMESFFHKANIPRVA